MLTGLTGLFLVLTAAFLWNGWGRPAPLGPVALAASEFTNTTTVRLSYADQLRAKADMSDFDCYGCHEEKKPPVLRFDTNHNLVLPKEHADLVLGHGRHNRNNNCFNCHNETNLLVLQPRDGRVLKMEDSTPLCGSCHGPTYRDWEAGVHGRTGGHWSPALGPRRREACVSCHNPHAPAFPPQKPAPAPKPLRPGSQPLLAKEGTH